MSAGILELDLHGSSQYQARIRINAALRRAGLEQQAEILERW